MMNQDELYRILDSHQLWLKDESIGRRAVLQDWPWKGEWKYDFMGYSLNGIMWINCDFGEDFFLSDMPILNTGEMKNSIFIACVFPSSGMSQIESRFTDEEGEPEIINPYCDIDFSHSMFVNCEIENCSFEGCSFLDVEFRRCNLASTDFSGSSEGRNDLTNLSIIRCKVGKTIFSTCPTWKEDFKYYEILSLKNDVLIKHPELDSCECQGLMLSGIAMKGADFGQANLVGAWLNACQFGAANFSEAKMRNAILAFADLRNSAFYRCDLRDTDFTGANLVKAEFCGADLRNALLVDANLEGADLSDCDLTSANLSGANLKGADLTNAKLDNADLTGAIMS